MGQRIAVLGAGANGASIGADLVRAGHDVTFLEQWPAHVEAMRADGIRVESGSQATVTRMPVEHLCDIASIRRPFDVIFLAMKSYDTRWACELARPVLAEDGAMVALQNGMSTEAMTAAVGADRAVSAVVEVGSALFVPGLVERHTPRGSEWFAVGGVHPVAHAKADAVADILRAAGTVEVVDDIESAKWMKLVLNAAELAPSALLDLSIVGAANLPGMREIMIAAGREAIDAGLALGYRIVPILGIDDVDPRHPYTFLDAMFEKLLTVFALPHTLTTILQDWRRGRRSEVDDINGLVAAAEARRGAWAPVNAAVTEMSARVERGELTPGIDLFDLLRTRASV